MFEAARALGLPVKLHADQLSNLHGAALAARFGALSADHLEHTDEAGAAAMARRRNGRRVAARGLLFHPRDQGAADRDVPQHGVPMAVATDCNPGTSPMTSLLLAMNMAATLFRTDGRGMHRRRHARSGARARARRRDRHAGSRQIGGPGDLEHRAARRTRLSDRLQSAARPRLEGPMTDILARSRRTSARGLARDLSRRRRDARSRLLAGVEASAAAVARIVAQGRAGLWRQHRLRQTRERSHRRGGPRDAATQHRAFACRRRRRADAGADRAADDGAEAREPGPGRLRRTAGRRWRSCKRCSRAA